MASRSVEDLRRVSEDLAKSGFPVSAGVCYQAADRMERMEQTIVDMQKQLEPVQPEHTQSEGK